MASIKSKNANSMVYFLIGYIMVLWGVLIALGGVCFDYVLSIWCHKDIPWWGDAICGLICSAVVVPAALVTWLVQMFGG